MRHTILLGLLLTAPVLAGDRIQIFAGRDFNALVARTQARCPAAPIRYAKAADLLDAEDRFVATLRTRDRRRLTTAIPREADGGASRCAKSPGGASCPASANLEAMRKARMLDRFAAFACRLPHRSWD